LSRFWNDRDAPDPRRARLRRLNGRSIAGSGRLAQTAGHDRNEDRAMSKTLGFVANTAMALILSACSQSGGNGQSAAANTALPALPQAVPLQPGPATPIAAAPSAAALPAAAPLRLARVAQPADAYAYLDRADGVLNAIGDAPPDYAYDDGDVSPWAWQTSGGDVQYAEPVDGGYRYYYYQPGADTPYLVRGPDYSYGYAGDELVAVYDDRGALLPPDAYADRASYASRYFARAALLYHLAREREHRGVVAANWAARRADFDAARAQWAENRAHQAAWQAYHDAHRAEEQSHWADERAVRAASADRFAGWQRTGFQNPAPPMPAPRVSGVPAAFVAQREQQQHHAAMERQQQDQQAAQLAAQHEHAAQDQAMARQAEAADRQQRVDAHAAHQREAFAQAQAAQRAAADQARAHAPHDAVTRQPGLFEAQHGDARQAMAAHAQMAAQHEQARAAEQQAHMAEQQQRQQAHAAMQAEHMAAQHMAPPHMEAPHMQAPHPEAPHFAPPPHASAPPPQAPHGGGGGGEHHHG
jgi:hypothetical protein